MSLGNTTENQLAKLIFNATLMNNIAENDTTTPATDFDIALHTADPGEAGTMATNEAAYTGYARESVSRSVGPGGWTVTAENVSNNGKIIFGTSTSGPETLTHWSVGKPGGGGAQIIAFGALDSSLPVNSGTTPTFAHGALDIDWD